MSQPIESGRFFARVKRREKEERETCARSEHKKVVGERVDKGRMFLQIRKRYIKRRKYMLRHKSRPKPI